MKESNKIFFEQYKLFAESAEKVSDRRQSTNNYFLTLNSALLAFTGYLTSISFRIWHIVLALAGISICILWILNIKSFRTLNSAKFKLLHKMEEQLPAKLFTNEWEYLDKGNKEGYMRFSKIEQGIPIVFLILYIIIIALRVFS
jgi:hypothetical protein